MSDSRPDTASGQARRVRRARYVLYLLGGVFTAIAVVADLSPPVAARVPDAVVTGSSLLAIVILSVGRFAPDRWVLRCEGWLRRGRLLQPEP